MRDFKSTSRERQRASAAVVRFGEAKPNYDSARRCDALINFRRSSIFAD